MNALKLLKEDHRKVEELFERYLEQEGNSKSQSICDQIFRDLEAHTAVEEEFLYPEIAKLKSAKAKKMVKESYVEHSEVKNLIRELKKMDLEDEEYEAKMDMLMENVTHHVEEEETELFPEVESEMENLDAMGDRIQARKEQLVSLRATPGAIGKKGKGKGETRKERTT